jgi:hypothetical protein
MALKLTLNPITGQLDLVQNLSAYAKITDLAAYAKLDGTNQPFTGDVEIVSGFYIGDKTTDGSWRLVPDGTSLKVQRLESATWTDKGEFTA